MLRIDYYRIIKQNNEQNKKSGGIYQTKTVYYILNKLDIYDIEFVLNLYVNDSPNTHSR